MKQILRLIKNQTTHLVISNFIISICLVSFFEILFSNYSYYSVHYFDSINLITHTLFVFILFMLLSSLSIKKGYLKVVPYLVLFSVLALFFITNTQSKNVYYAMMSSLVMGGLVYYYLPKFNFKLTDQVTLKICCVLAFLFFLFVASLTITNYLSYKAPNYDFGIFSQMFHYMSETLIPYTTVERNGLLNHFAVHFSPILYLILPFYLLFSSPITLLVLQPIILISGLIPLVKLSKHFKLSNFYIAIISLVYILYPALIGGNFFYFHENKFLTPLLLWLFYFIEKKSNPLIYIFAFLIMFVKEDAPIYIGFTGLYVIFGKKNWRQGLSLILLAVAYFIAVTQMLSIFGEGVMSYRYKNFLFSEDASLYTIIFNIFKNPAFLFKEIISAEKLIFLVYMFLPLGLIPLLIKKPANIILLLPMVLINLMSYYDFQFNINYQYTYGSLAFIFYLTLINIKELKKEALDKLLVSAAFISLIFFASTHFYRFNYLREYQREKDIIKTIDEGLSLIPKNNSIKASTFFIAHLWNYNEIYDYDYTDRVTDYVILDLRYDELVSKQGNYDDDYNLVYHEDYIISIYRKKGL